MPRFKNPEELETFIISLENANKGLSEDVKKLKEQLKKLRKSKKSEMDTWFYGEEKDENDENEKE